MLILEIAAGVCLGLLACIALWFGAAVTAHWYKEQRWWWGYQKHERMVRKLSQRYSRRMLKEGDEEALEKFDPKAMAKIKEYGLRVDAMRDAL